jgi:uncharacterized protein YbjT (DUF2867 family)
VNRGGVVLLTGAGGFIGGFIEAALRGAGWQVRRVVRRPQSEGDAARDLSQAQSPSDWLPLLDGVGAVVNAAGILRERRGESFAAVHHGAPLALAQACAERGIDRFVQVSALGDPRDGEFVASKHRFDAELIDRLPRSLVLRPSVVYSAAGSHGGTSLLRALAGMPGAMFLPGSGAWPLQPLPAEDLAELVVRGVDGTATGIYEVGGPDVVTYRDYLLAWRRWLRVGGRRTWRVPAVLVDAFVAAGELSGGGPLGRTTWRMLTRGNVLQPGALARLQADFGFVPRRLGDALAARPSQVQDRWHARLYLLRGPLKWGVVGVWLLSAWSGFVTPAATIEHLASASVLASLQPVAIARAAAALDLLLAGWLAAARAPRLPVALMFASVLAYTAVFGTMLPAAWLDPLGGLAKNLVVLPALAVLWAISERR